MSVRCFWHRHFLMKQASLDIEQAHIKKPGEFYYLPAFYFAANALIVISSHSTLLSEQFVRLAVIHEGSSGLMD